MIKGLKRQEKKALHWRPNFRDAEHLPDIKTVRTGFFVNAVVGTLAIAIAMFVGFREYTIADLGNSIEEIKGEIEEYRVENDVVVRKNKFYRDSMLKMNEIVSFVEGKVVVSELLIDIAQAMSEGMTCRRFNYTETTAVFDGTLKASEDSDSAMNEFIERLRNIKSLRDRFTSFEQTSVTRQKGTGYLDFTIEISGSKVNDRERRRAR